MKHSKADIQSFRGFNQQKEPHSHNLDNENTRGDKASLRAEVACDQHSTNEAVMKLAYAAKEAERARGSDAAATRRSRNRTDGAEDDYFPVKDSREREVPREAPKTVIPTLDPFATTPKIDNTMASTKPQPAPEQRPTLDPSVAPPNKEAGPRPAISGPAVEIIANAIATTKPQPTTEQRPTLDPHVSPPTKEMNIRPVIVGPIVETPPADQIKISVTPKVEDIKIPLHAIPPIATVPDVPVAPGKIALQPEVIRPISQSPQLELRPANIVPVNTSPPIITPDNSRAEISVAHFERRLLRQEQITDAIIELREAIRGDSPFKAPDAARIAQALEGKDYRQLTQIKEIYAERYGQSVAEEIKVALKDKPRTLERVTALLEGEGVKIDAHQFKVQLEQLPRNQAEFLRALEERTPQQIIILKQTFEEMHRVPIQEALAAKLQGAELERAAAYFTRPVECLEAVKLRDLIRSGSVDFTDIQKILREWDQPKLTAITEEYRKLFTTSLQEDLRTALKNPSPELIQNLLQGDPAKTFAIALQRAMDNPREVMKSLQALCESLAPAEIIRLKAYYREQTGNDLVQALKEVLREDPIAAKLAERIIVNNGPTKADEVMLALRLSPDTSRELAKEKLITIIEDSKAQQIEAIKNEIKSQYGVNIAAEIPKNFPKPQDFELKLYMLGKPETLYGETAVINAKHEFERPLPHRLSDRMAERLSENAKLLDKNILKINEQHQRISQPDLIVSDEDEFNLYQLLDFAEDDIRKYRKARKVFARSMANTCGLVFGVILAAVANAFGQPLFSAVVMGLAFGGVTRVVTASYFSQRFGDEGKILENLNNTLNGKRRGKASRRSRRHRIRRRLDDLSTPRYKGRRKRR